MSLTDEEIVDIILGGETGRIAALNLFGGFSIGQFSHHELKDIFRLWVNYIDFAGKGPGEAALALGMLRYLYHTPPVGYVAPLVPAFDPYIVDRISGGLGVGSRGSCVKSAAFVSDWGDTKDLEDNGIDFKASPGTAKYDRLAGDPDRTYVVEVKAGKTVSNPRDGACAIMFYTEAGRLWSELAPLAFEERADGARDRLGLVMEAGGSNLVHLTFEGDLAENRLDRGRPTAIDAGGYPRFACDLNNGGATRNWGQTADLSRCLPNTIGEGLPERVCGPFPPTTPAKVEIEVRFLGRPDVPRRDLPGVDDDVFADALDMIASTRQPGFQLRDEILSLLS